MKRINPYLMITCLCFFGFAGACATHNAQMVTPTPLLEAQEEIPEDALLDVGITVFLSEDLSEKDIEEGAHPDVRKAETHFIPYHLKNTLQDCSLWGAVRVLPIEATGTDLIVKGKIIESNGEKLLLDVEVVDASGKIWLHKAYKAEATEKSYSDNLLGQKDAYQDLYNTIANDMATFKAQLSDGEIQKIRSISELKFAADFAPDAFGTYLEEGNGGNTEITRLPADDDPMRLRLLQIKERDHMYVDILNEYYEGFYNEMWPAYEDWRQTNLVERTAYRKIKRDAFIRQAAGALMLATAIALGAGNVDNTQSLQNVLILGGGAVIVDGFNVSKQAEIHSMAIQELSESFGSEMKPVVMEFQDKKYELSGSAEEQYTRWRELLRKIYYAETGFDQADGPSLDRPGDH